MSVAEKSSSFDEAGRHPPRPRLTLRVGVTGKRELVASDGVRSEIAKVLDLLAYALHDCWKNNQVVLAPERPLLRVICGLAEGADQLVADVTVEYAKKKKDSPVETKLAAILPFPEKEFIRDFGFDPNREEAPRTPQEQAPVTGKFETLLTEAKKEAVLELDDEALRASGQKAHRDLAYLSLRDLLVQHADIILAIFDEKQEGKPGGSADVTRLAGQERVPVIRISTVGEPVSLLRAADLDDPDQRPRPEGAPLKLDDVGSLNEPVAAILAPPRAGDQPNQHGAHGSRPARARLDLFFKEDFAPAYFDRVFKSFRDGLTVERKAGECIWLKGIAAFVSTWLDYQRDPVTPEQKITKTWPERYNVFSADGGSKARDVLAARYGWADVLAVRYADATRSAHIGIAALGALAVLIAVAPLVLPQEPDPLALIIKICALTLEVGVLLIAGVLVFRQAHDQRWHERMVEYRAVAELLRHERFIYALGAADRPAKNADRTWSEPDAWVGWYVRATLRELGFPAKVLSAQSRRDVLAAFLKDELQGDDGQIAYNALLAEHFNTIDRRLESIVRQVFWLTVRIGIFGIILLSALLLLEVYYHGPYHQVTHKVTHFIKPWFTVIAAFFPALIAAVHGVRFQIEFRFAAIRAEATKRDLLEVESQAKLALAAPSPGRKQSVALVRAANEAMSADLAGWSSVYRGKGPELG